MRVLGPIATLTLLLAAGCLAPAGEPLQKGIVEGEPTGAPSIERASLWAQPDEARVRPGVPIHTFKRECPSNFVFTRPDQSSVFIGSTAYCFRDQPVGTLVTIANDTVGMLVYSSFEAMANANEQDPDAREYNDFAIIRIDEPQHALISPAILQIGGPTAPADPTNVPPGARVRALVNGTTVSNALVTGRAGDWAYLVHMLPPATPGQMGGPVIDADGRALGVLVNLGALPNPGANGVARLDKLMAYADEHAKLRMGLEVAPLTG